MRSPPQVPSWLTPAANRLPHPSRPPPACAAVAGVAARLQGELACSNAGSAAAELARYRRCRRAQFGSGWTPCCSFISVSTQHGTLHERAWTF